mmetsp:Transcript_14502/g.41534  ORF Transcript_14502/g.41534 Transcript_14502/m.41534 type:complete len:206 (+) Transcript_14502:431-1048(+)
MALVRLCLNATISFTRTSIGTGILPQPTYTGASPPSMYACTSASWAPPKSLAPSSCKAWSSTRKPWHIDAVHAFWAAVGLPKAQGGPSSQGLLKYSLFVRRQDMYVDNWHCASGSVPVVFRMTKRSWPRQWPKMPVRSSSDLGKGANSLMNTGAWLRCHARNGMTLYWPWARTTSGPSICKVSQNVFAASARNALSHRGCSWRYW